MGSIRGTGPDGGPPYKITIKRGGQRWYFTRDSERAAQKVAGLAEDDLDNGRDPYDRYEIVRPTPQMLLRDWAPVWLAAQDLEESSRMVVGRVIRHDIIPAFGHLEVAAITHIAAKGWLTRLRREPRARTGQPPSPVTVTHIWGVFSRMMGAAVLEGLAEKDPCRGLTPPRRPKRSENRHLLTPRQVVLLAEEIARPKPKAKGRKGGVTTPAQWRHRALTLTSAWTGCRPSELLGLRRTPDELQLLRRPAPAIVVHEPIKIKTGGRYHGNPKSQAGRRTVELIQPIADLLAAHVTHGYPYVFGTNRGTAGHHITYWEAVKEAAEALGHPEWTPYDLRHSQASWIKGCDRAAVKERLGHDPEDVTDVYTHVTAADRAGILKVLGELWGEAQKVSLTKAIDAS